MRGGRAWASAPQRTVLLMNLAAIMERADESVLPAIFLFVGRSLGASLAEVGSVALCRAAVQAAVSPLSGALGDRLSRARVVAGGAAVWALATAALGASRSLASARLAASLSGAGLALVVPCVQSVVADCHAPARRGRAFGLTSLVSSLGAMAWAYAATAVGGRHIGGAEGWRAVLAAVSVVSLAVALLVALFAVEPRSMDPAVLRGARGAVGRAHAREADDGSDEPSDPLLSDGPEGPSPTKPAEGGDETSAAAVAAAAGAAPPRRFRGEGDERGPSGAAGLSSPPRDWSVRAVWRDAKAVLRVRSFQALLAQGVVGSIPWQAMGMFTLWLQLLGFHDRAAATIVAGFSIGCALGSALGGLLGDRAASTNPNHGRILVAQCSVALGLPLTWFALRALPAAVLGGGGAGLLPPPAASAGRRLLDLALSRAAAGPVLDSGSPARLGAGGPTGPDEAARRALGPLEASSLRPSPLAAFRATFALLGLVISWCGVNNGALMAELVPRDLRSSIFALDRGLEGIVGACGAPLVGLIAERAFGFRPDALAERRAGALEGAAGGGAARRGEARARLLAAAVSGTPPGASDAPATDPPKASAPATALRAIAGITPGGADADALARALLVMLVVPWVMCLLAYCLAHFTFPRDRKRALYRKPGSCADLELCDRADLEEGWPGNPPPDPKGRGGGGPAPDGNGRAGAPDPTREGRETDLPQGCAIGGGREQGARKRGGAGGERAPSATASRPPRPPPTV